MAVSKERASSKRRAAYSLTTDALGIVVETKLH